MHANAWTIALTSFGVCAGVLPIVRRVAVLWNLYDAPTGPLKIHSIPIPRIGGVALVGGLVAGVAASGVGFGYPILGFYLALTLIWAAGFVDDLRGLSAASRLAVQIGAAILLSQTPWRLLLFGNGMLDTAATCLFVAVFANAFNFLDGADGLAGGVAGIVGLGYAVVYGIPVLSAGGAIAWGLLGSCLGFLVFNFPPARIFMGDSGSTTLGVVVAFLGLDFYRVHHGLGSHLLVPIVFAALPLMDFFIAVLRRLRRRVSPFSGDRQHFYDLLLQQGWSARRVVLGAYAVTTIFLALGWLCNQRDWTSSLVLLFLVLAYLLTTAIRLGSLRYQVPGPPGSESAANPVDIRTYQT